MIPAHSLVGAISRFFRDHTWREERVAAYVSVGISVFLTSFFWAPTCDFMHVVYVWSFLAPACLSCSCGTQL